MKSEEKNEIKKRSVYRKKVVHVCVFVCIL